LSEVLQLLLIEIFGSVLGGLVALPAAGQAEKNARGLPEQ